MSIQVKDLSKNFGSFRAVDGVNFSLETGDLAALLGPSGSGKSTLLRMIAGLESPDRGSILLTGQESTLLTARERNVGFVFQHYALFKHMTVWDNIAFGLQVRKTPEDEIERRVTELLEVVQLKGLERRYPDQLSGGQRQRVAVARTLAPRPGVLLLDEPFGALDAKVRAELRAWMRELHKLTHVTTLFVTHDQHEALEVADRIFVMNQGRLEQEGSPLEIFDHPATPFVAEFVGETNFVEGEVCAPETVCWGPFRFPVKDLSLGKKARIYFRPNDVYVSSAPAPGLIPGRINETRFRGALIELEIGVEGNRKITAQVPKGVSLSSGFQESRLVYVEITSFHAFPA